MKLTRRSLPNLLTGMRLLSIPVLWGFALAGRDTVVGAGIFFAWLTDALDGFLARRLRAETAWGSRFDSLTDALVFASALVWVALLRPEFVREQAVPLIAWLAIGGAAYAVGWVRFRRIADVHLYSAKAANFVGFLFIAHLLAFDAFHSAVFYVVIAVLIAAAAETLLALASLDEIDTELGTVLRRRPRRRAAGGEGTV